jgi:hypothetical protein
LKLTDALLKNAGYSWIASQFADQENLEGDNDKI